MRVAVNRALKAEERKRRKEGLGTLDCKLRKNQDNFWYYDISVRLAMDNTGGEA